jgi:polar amino acid transport system substrate-binding protein
MKKLFLILSTLIIASMLLAACATPAPVAPAATNAPAANALPDLGGKKITVAVENAYPPFNSIDATTNKGVGWDYDTVTEICKRINCVPEFKQASWDGVFTAMQAGEYDMLADGASYTDERAKIVDFSKPYLMVSQVLLVRTDETRTPDQMKTDDTAKIGTQIGTTNEIAAKKFFEGKKIQSFEDFGASILALIAKDVDGVVIDFVPAKGYIKDNAGKLKLGGEITQPEPLAFAFPPKSTLTAAVNAALAAMEADGTLAALNKKWDLSK